MPNVVVVGAIVECSHGGRASLTSGDSRLSVDDNPAVLAGQEVGVSFAPGAPGLLAPCTHQTSAKPPAPAPCAATLAAGPSGISTLWVVGGKGALLDTASGTATNPDDLSATWKISDPGQNKLSVDR